MFYFLNFFSIVEFPRCPFTLPFVHFFHFSYALIDLGNPADLIHAICLFELQKFFI